METKPSVLSPTGDPEVDTEIQELLQRFGPHAAFGEPVREGETLVIPVAEVRFGFGFGRGRKQADRGSGGGGGGVVKPRGFIEVAGGHVRYRPILDVQALVLGGMALAGALAFAFFRWSGR